MSVYHKEIPRVWTHYGKKWENKFRHQPHEDVLCDVHRFKFGLWYRRHRGLRLQRVICVRELRLRFAGARTAGVSDQSLLSSLDEEAVLEEQK